MTKQLCLLMALWLVRVHFLLNSFIHCAPTSTDFLPTKQTNDVSVEVADPRVHSLLLVLHRRSIQSEAPLDGSLIVLFYSYFPGAGSNAF